MTVDYGNLNYKKNSRRKFWFWLFFWLAAGLFLLLWWLYWQFKFIGFLGAVKYFSPILKFLPIEKNEKQIYQDYLDIVSKLTDGEERRIFVFFQNNYELRPGGGRLEYFGIIKIKKNKIILEKIYSAEKNSNNFVDSSRRIESPYPLALKTGTFDWSLKDGNWSADFSKNVSTFKEFYLIGSDNFKEKNGQVKKGEKFDGAIAVSFGVLVSFLEILGPVEIETENFDQLNSQNFIEKMEPQNLVLEEKRKDELTVREKMLTDFFRQIDLKWQNADWATKTVLLKKIEKHLKEKDILLNFEEAEIQEKIQKLNFSGELKKTDGDFLMLVDANLNAKKTDMVIRRTFDYSVDLTGDKPKIKLRVFYQNNGRVRDFMTTDYQSYLRVYVPAEAWLKSSFGLAEQLRFGRELDKKYFGFNVFVPLGKKAEIELEYELDLDNLNGENYQLLIQKQSGIEKISGTVRIVNKNGKIKSFSINEREDVMIKLR